ncbi:hypothetical protein C2G38_2029378 [Gigaspora rosea]|uniref:Uncharacterized protein n=1 Tax=Gigaspora rosea TaxID=44941 RepID=A0A397W810_9GLOM|nr:hypothetical protein C2G38_2029378 [Gigaspora rosea]
MQPTIESLRELNSRLVLKIDELRKKFTENEAENTELKGEITVFLAKEAELMVRIIELEQFAKESAENSKLRDSELNELRSRVSKLKQKQLKNNIVHRLKDGDNSSENVNVPDPAINQCIDTNAKLLEDKEMIDFLDGKNKEKDSLSVPHIISTNDLRKLKKEEVLIQEISSEKNYTNENLSSDREKKLRFEDLFSNNNSLETNPKDSTEKIPYNQKVERGLRLVLFICTKDNNHKINKVFDIQVPEFSLEAILTGSSKLTSQNIVDLFKVAMKVQQKESLCCSKDVSNIKASIPTESSHTSNSEDMISENNKSLPETKTLDEYPNLYREFSSKNFDYYGITDETLCGVSRETICPLCKLGHDDEEIEGILTDKIQSNLYKKYKKETGHEPWQLSKAVIVSAKPQAPDFKPITFEARPDPELIIKSVLEHFPYLKFRNSFRPWSALCSICNGKHGNYGLHGE